MEASNAEFCSHTEECASLIDESKILSVKEGGERLLIRGQ